MRTKSYLMFTVILIVFAATAIASDEITSSSIKTLGAGESGIVLAAASTDEEPAESAEEPPAEPAAAPAADSDEEKAAEPKEEKETKQVKQKAPLPARKRAWYENISVSSLTLYESHSINGGDNAMMQSVNFGAQVGRRASLMGTAGFKYDLEDSDKANTLFGLAYIYAINKRSFVLVSYSTYQFYGGADDNITAFDMDTWYVMHSWQIMKNRAGRISLRTAFTTDPAFDNSRFLSESLFYKFPIGGTKLTGTFGYQYNHSFVTDNHAFDVYDFGVTLPLGGRQKKISLSHRTVDFASKTNDTIDNIWYIAYSLLLK